MLFRSATNQVALGARYQGTLGGVGLLAYGVWMNSGHAQYTGPNPSTAVGAANIALANAYLGNVPGSRYTGNYDGLNLGSGGIALTFAGFTVGGNMIGGRVNGQLGLAPQGGAPLVAGVAGVKYVAGPWTVGVVAEKYTQQGNVNMTGLTQQRDRAIDGGVSYVVAPGMTVWAEYMWQDVYQGGVNQITGAVGSGANNEIRSQGFLLGDVVNF